MNKIFSLSVAIAVIVSTVSVASAQSGRDRRAVRNNGQVVSNNAVPTGPWSEPRRVIARPSRPMPRFTWEEKRLFDYQNNPNVDSE